VKEIPIIIYTLQQFQKNKHIDRIVIACIAEWHPVLRAYSREFDISKLEYIAEGGATGIESIRNCFNSLTDSVDSDIVIIHDGNRPLVDDSIIESNIEATKRVGATTTYIDIHDGIVKVDDSLRIQESDFVRNYMKSTQTPHGFQTGLLKEVFAKIDDDNKYISLADAAAKLGYEVNLVKGSEINFKITTPNDLVLFEAILNTRFGNVQ
jgi:2-C-methyl-D-erythritol 4-phosphate cytidylyltransferase